MYSLTYMHFGSRNKPHLCKIHVCWTVLNVSTNTHKQKSPWVETSVRGNSVMQGILLLKILLKSKKKKNQTGPSQSKFYTLFSKKNPSQDFIQKTLTRVVKRKSLVIYCGFFHLIPAYHCQATAHTGNFESNSFHIFKS